MIISDYELACRVAARNQGLNPIQAALKKEKINFELEQTGGFTMVVTVTLNDDLYAITRDAGEYIFCRYAAKDWNEGSAEEWTNIPATTTKAVIEFLKGEIAIRREEGRL